VQRNRFILQCGKGRAGGRPGVRLRRQAEELPRRDRSHASITDPSGKLFSKLKAVGMPTTLLLDREGHEIGRLVGPANWDSPEALALIKAAIAAPAGA